MCLRHLYHTAPSARLPRLHASTGSTGVGLSAACLDKRNFCHERCAGAFQAVVVGLGREDPEAEHTEVLSYSVVSEILARPSTEVCYLPIWTSHGECVLSRPEHRATQCCRACSNETGMSAGHDALPLPDIVVRQQRGRMSLPLLTLVLPTATDHI